MPVQFSAVADDDTGATDLAGMLAGRGMHTVLLLDQPPPSDFERWTYNADAVLIGTASRSISPGEAYRKTRDAVRLLSSLQPQVLAVKYCSTFDSTPLGNIGPSIDAAMDETGEKFTVALPALPVNKRTTYMGHHFVGQQLLSDSSMKNHPLNPMTNSNLIEHLQSQTQRRVGLIAYPDVQAGATGIGRRMAQLAGEGVEIAIVDCTSEHDLQTISQGLENMFLVTGSSALGIYLPRSWQEKAPVSLPAVKASDGSGFLVVAGSYSEATRRQNEWLAANGATTHTLDALSLARGCEIALAPAVQDTLRAGGTCLLRVSRDRERVQECFLREGTTAIEAGERIAAGLAQLIRAVVSKVRPKGLVLAGGETSSIIARALGFRALQVGTNIEPGVPVCVTLSEPAIPVVFKSGNFGGDDFYRRAMDAMLSSINN